MTCSLVMPANELETKVNSAASVDGFVIGSARLLVQKCKEMLEDAGAAANGEKELPYGMKGVEKVKKRDCCDDEDHCRDKSELIFNAVTTADNKNAVTTAAC